MNNFPRRLRDARADTGLTQKQFAEKAQVSVSAYATYEQGTKTPPLSIAFRIAKALDVSLDWLSGLVTQQDVLRSLFETGHTPTIKAKDIFVLSAEEIKNLKEGK
jgi:transcriptional regulator with XRE-family HTH domain